MRVTMVHVHVKPESVDAFIEASLKNQTGSVKEVGSVRFDILQDPKDPTRFVLYEVFVSDAAVAVHKETEHYLAWRDTVAEMMAEPRKGVPWRGLLGEG